MASVLTFPAGRSFRFRVEKHATGNVSDKWINTHWAVSTASGSLTDLVMMGRAIVEFERTLTRDWTNFTRWSVSTGAHEFPHVSENFYEEPIGALGLWGGLFEAQLDKRVCLWIAKSTVVGRMGRLMLRGSLSESEVEATAGSFAISALAGLALVIRLAAAQVYIASYLANGGNTVLRYCLIKPDGTDVRAVTDLIINGVTVVKHNHAYFDRAVHEQGENEYPETLDNPVEVEDLEPPTWMDVDPVPPET